MSSATRTDLSTLHSQTPQILRIFVGLQLVMSATHGELLSSSFQLSTHSGAPFLLGIEALIGLWLILGVVVSVAAISMILLFGAAMFLFEAPQVLQHSYLLGAAIYLLLTPQGPLHTRGESDFYFSKLLASVNKHKAEILRIAIGINLAYVALYTMQAQPIVAGIAICFGLLFIAKVAPQLTTLIFLGLVNVIFFMIGSHEAVVLLPIVASSVLLLCTDQIAEQKQEEIVFGKPFVAKSERSVYLSPDHFAEQQQKVFDQRRIRRQSLMDRVTRMQMRPHGEFSNRPRIEK